MLRLGYLLRCSSRTKQLLILLYVTFMSSGVIIYYNYCSLLAIATDLFLSSKSTGSVGDRFFPACSSRTGSGGYQDNSPSKSIYEPCKSYQRIYNTTSCPTCVRPAVTGLESSFREVIPRDKSVTRANADYFKVKSEFVEHLVTDYLAVPRLSTPNNYYLMVVQLSILDRKRERDVVRETWGSIARQQTWPNRTINAPVKVIFVVARQFIDESRNDTRNASKVFDDITKEAELYEDILFLNMIDSYRNLTLKLLSAFKWVKDNCPCVKFVLKVDYDTFVNVPLLVDTLLYYENRFQFSILGTIYQHKTGVQRYGKWAVPESVFPMESYPDYASGCGYVLSFKALSQIVEDTPHFHIFAVEDAFITGVMRRVVGCQVFTFPRLFTHYLDKKWFYCWMMQDRKILGMNAGGHLHQKIWESFVRNSCS